MPNLLILYNPYYNQEMIEDHIRILDAAPDPVQARVGFGKIRSRIRDYEHSRQENIDTISDAVSPEKPLQLFLTDFSNMYVCRVEQVSDRLAEGVEGVEVPAYYGQLDVERWFVVTDIREIARGDFEYVRDRVLVGLTTPNYGDHTYALYGNRYDYPLEVRQKVPLDYFEEYADGVRHFTRVFRSSQYTTIQRDLRHYVFGSLLYRLHPDSLDAIVEAEVQYATHKDNATYDFAAITILYAKAFENEIYYFLRNLFGELMGYDAALETLPYRVQGMDYTLYDYLRHKPNMGTQKYLLSQRPIYEAFSALYSDRRRHSALLTLIAYRLKDAITTFQSIRNEAAHGGTISRAECETVRGVLLGVGDESILTAVLKMGREYFG